MGTVMARRAAWPCRRRRIPAWIWWVQPLVFPIILMPYGLAVIRPRVLQVLGLILGIIQLALGIGQLFTALEVQALAIQALLR